MYAVGGEGWRIYKGICRTTSAALTRMMGGEVVFQMVYASMYGVASRVRTLDVWIGLGALHQRTKNTTGEFEEQC